MARKSRRTKNTFTLKDTILNKTIPERKGGLLAAAAYGRLSVENSGHETDESLQTQMSMLHEYIDSHPDLKMAGSYSDNGYTGTNFERPEFARLMGDVRKGKIQCIVVKDLSRFGRDYLETGYYLETVFPRLNVRFIAVTDDFDSIREEDRNSLSVPIKNMVNTMYAKDISRKMCAAFDIRYKNPAAMPPGNAPFGYRLSGDRKKYIAEEKDSATVIMIFAWARHGVSVKKIAQRMKLIGADTPGQSRVRKTGKQTSPAGWREDVVYKILRNPCYTGNLYMGKTKQALYRSEKRHRTAPEQWHVWENTHEPLVIEEDYRQIQETMKENRKINRSPKSMAFHIRERKQLQGHFRNMVYCTDCGRPMHFVRCTHNYKTLEKSAACYICPQDNGKATCGGRTVYEDFLKIIVMDQIDALIKNMCSRKKMLDKTGTAAGRKNALLSIREKIHTLEGKIAETGEYKSKLYEDYTAGILDKDDYQDISERYLTVSRQLQEELLQLKQQQRKMEKTVMEYGGIVKRMKPYLGKRDFDEKLVQELVERISISGNNRVEITFKHDGICKEIDNIIHNTINYMTNNNMMKGNDA